jgi:hypothetical protein
MKKTTKISPLKTFNDIHAARVKKFGNVTMLKKVLPKHQTDGPTSVTKPILPAPVKAPVIVNESFKNNTDSPINVTEIKPKPSGIYDYKTGKEIVYTTAGPKLAKKHGGAIKSKKK